VLEGSDLVNPPPLSAIPEIPFGGWGSKGLYSIAQHCHLQGQWGKFLRVSQINHLLKSSFQNNQMVKNLTADSLEQIFLLLPMFENQ
jgi:hypothetical protein